MRYVYMILTLFLVIQGAAGISRSHAMLGGAEIHYRYLGDDTYMFYYVLYTECGQFPEWETVSLCYRNVSCGNIWSTERIDKLITTPDGRPNGQQINLTCPGREDKCNDPDATASGYREWWYGGKVKLGSKCRDWTFSVNYGPRNDNITNLIVQPWTDWNVYVEAVIDNTLHPDQSSPYFTNRAPVYACEGIPFHYNHGVVDPDGDSLVYNLIMPRSATWDLFVKCGGYPPMPLYFSSTTLNLTNNPLFSGNTFGINALTGDISFTPNAVQLAALAYRVDKYRDGILIGSVTRDFALDVRSCNAPEPQLAVDLSSVQGGTVTGDTIVLCNSDRLEFCFTVSPANAGASARFLVGDNGDIVLGTKNAVTYSGQESASVTGCVSWKPEPGDNGFRYLIVNVTDMACSDEFAVTQSLRIPLLVREAARILADSPVICPGVSARLRGYGGGTYQWSSEPAGSFSCNNCAEPFFTPSAPVTTIRLESPGTGCRSSDTLTLLVDTSNRIEVSPREIVLCDGPEYVLLSSAAYGPRPLKEPGCGASPSMCSGTLDTVYLAQGSNNSNGNNIHHGFASYYGPFYQHFRTQKMQVIFRKDELRTAGMVSGRIQQLALHFAPYAGVPPEFSNVRISMRCTDKFEFVHLAHSEFQTGLTEVFSASSVTLGPGWNNFDFKVAYEYDTSKHLIVEFCYSGVAPHSNLASGGMLPVYWVGTPYASTLSSGQTAAGDACANPLGGPVTSRRRPDIRFGVCDMPEEEFKYRWTPDTGMDDPGAAETGVYPDSATWYVVSTRGRSGCVLKDSIYVHLPAGNFKIEPPYAELCEGEEIRLEAKNGHRHYWMNEDHTVATGMSCTDCPDPLLQPAAGSYRYYLAIEDAYGCGDTLSAGLKVKPVSKTRILNADTLIRYGESLVLKAEGATYYLWRPAEDLNAEEGSEVIAAPRKTTLYIVGGTEPEGCPPVYDSVLVEVDMIEKIMVPSAFTPNGDGKNDLFRIANLRYSNIELFVIRNRWGQELYRSAGGDNGWDGTWNGVPQQLGTYFYQIRVRHPGGVVEDFKGDVTLIR